MFNLIRNLSVLFGFIQQARFRVVEDEIKKTFSSFWFYSFEANFKDEYELETGLSVLFGFIHIPSSYDYCFYESFVFQFFLVLFKGLQIVPTFGGEEKLSVLFGFIQSYSMR